MSETTAQELDIARILNHAGAYCGECNFEDGFEGQYGCGQCASSLAGYARSLLASDWLAKVKAEVWREGFAAGRNADHNPCWWPANPHANKKPAKD